MVVEALHQVIVAAVMLVGVVVEEEGDVLVFRNDQNIEV